MENEKNSYSINNNVEIDSLLITLGPTSFKYLTPNIEDSENSVLHENIFSTMTIYSKSRPLKSDSSFNKILKPFIIGELLVFNIKLKILIWYADDISVLYKKVIDNIKKVKENRKNNMVKTNKVYCFENDNGNLNSFNSDMFIYNEYYNCQLNRFPPILLPGANLITGKHSIVLFLEELSNNVPTCLYTRGSKTPIILPSFPCKNTLEIEYIYFTFINNIFIELLNLIDVQSNAFKQKEHDYPNKFSFKRIQNRIDLAINFYYHPDTIFIKEDVKRVIEYIENYFESSDPENNDRLKISDKKLYKFHYFNEESCALKSNIKYRKKKIGEILLYYHNTSFYRNEFISYKSAPHYFNNINSKMLKMESIEELKLKYKKFGIKALENGFIPRIELRTLNFFEMQNDKILVSFVRNNFPIILNEIANLMDSLFNKRRKKKIELASSFSSQNNIFLFNILTNPPLLGVRNSDTFDKIGVLNYINFGFRWILIGGEHVSRRKIYDHILYHSKALNIGIMNIDIIFLPFELLKSKMDLKIENRDFFAQNFFSEYDSI